jgi:hypothetical protein
MNKKTLIRLAIAGAALAVAFGVYLWNKPHQDMASAKADMAIDAKMLYDEFKNNETDANAKYLEKIIQVKGVVAETNKNEGTTVIVLGCGDPMGGVACELDPLSKHEKTDFQPGEEVIFKGTCSGMLSDVSLSRCVMIK